MVSTSDHFGRAANSDARQALGDALMRNLIKTVAVLALLNSRAAVAQTTTTARSSAAYAPATATAPPTLTQGMQLVGNAPVGHRQPHAQDVPSESPGDLERLGTEDAAVDRKLVICRGC
jgi:hypothetical protein